MKFGYSSVNNAWGIHPGTLARELESRGFESIWIPEHSHIPINSVDMYPDPRTGLLSGYAHMMSPFISLMAAASNSSTLKLATGMCLPLEHDLLDLACTTATLDVLSDGRLILGVGAGWNSEEFNNHRPNVPFSKRYSALKERVAALRAAWGQNVKPYDGLFSEQQWSGQISSFQGAFDNFTDSWVFPKPKSETIPVALGLTGPLGVKHAAAYADIWAPVDTALYQDGKPDVAGRLEHFRKLTEETGRNRDDVAITLFVWGGESFDLIESYISMGIERLVFVPPSFTMHSENDSLKRLDSLCPYIERFASA